MTDYQELKSLAEAATPGPWECREAEGSAAICHQHGWVADDFSEQTLTDTRYMAAANPAVVLELLTSLESARQKWVDMACLAGEACQRHDQLKSVNFDYFLGKQAQDEEIERLKAENNSLRNDNKSLRGSCEAIGKLYKSVKRDRNAFRRECVRLEADVMDFKEANADLSRLNEMRRNHLANTKKAAGIGHDDDLVGVIEAMRKDAERYRYLRNGAYSFVNSRAEVVAIEDMDAPAGDFTDGAEMLDAAVDAAMSKEADR